MIQWEIQYHWYRWIIGDCYLRVCFVTVLSLVTSVIDRRMKECGAPMERYWQRYFLHHKSHLDWPGTEPGAFTDRGRPLATRGTRRFASVFNQYCIQHINRCYSQSHVFSICRPTTPPAWLNQWPVVTFFRPSHVLLFFYRPHSLLWSVHFCVTTEIWSLVSWRKVDVTTSIY